VGIAFAEIRYAALLIKKIREEVLKKMLSMLMHPLPRVMCYVTRDVNK
jgi:hypothetical protein